MALLAGVGTGVWPNVPEACEVIIHETDAAPRIPTAPALYAKYHAQYQRLYPALRDEFQRIALLER